MKRRQKGSDYLGQQCVRNHLLKTRLQRDIEATDRQIDQLVYELYELTPDEIKTVEKQQRNEESLSLNFAGD
jgi:hypothetical protein